MTENQNISKPRRLIGLFDGRVQGVGFRFTTVEIARGYAISGFVQNLMDGSVKVVAEGTEDELTRFLRDVREAHIYRYVTREDIHWQDATGEYDAFEIRYA